MKSNLPTFLIVGLIVIGIAFYWFEVRPTQIRKKCDEKVLTESLYSVSQAEREKLRRDMNKINALEREKSTFWYEQCLHENGISK